MRCKEIKYSTDEKQSPHIIIITFELKKKRFTQTDKTTRKDKVGEGFLRTNSFSYKRREDV
jgi:hypothetical protein